MWQLSMGPREALHVDIAAAAASAKAGATLAAARSIILILVFRAAHRTARHTTQVALKAARTRSLWVETLFAHVAATVAALSRAVAAERDRAVLTRREAQFARPPSAPLATDDAVRARALAASFTVAVLHW
mmetsp:Transcript_2994/g.6416  ORF Transcript_2994/g.6416 Transcript_2994/m.6416 type:complete len:131 (-) Transcript_2994:64-456(-)